MSAHPDSHNPDFDFEPVPGLPENLPKGERLLWQGSPDPRAMAYNIMHLRSVGSAFAAMALWWGLAGWHDGASSITIATTVAATILSGAVALGILALSGVLMARGTVYSLTSRRLVIRHGVAMPMAINIPFSKIDSASLSEGRGGFGNVAFVPHARSRTSYVALWPHARPWQVIRPEPTLRCIPDAATVAHLAAQALAADAGHTSAQTAAAATIATARPLPQTSHSRSSARSATRAPSTNPVLS